MESTPFFSIVVVCLNVENSIEKTVASVLRQTFPNYEIIVKDGMSKDRTIERIPSDERITVYQIPDTGIYDAMNQASEYARGRYVLYLNCGDFLFDENVLQDVYNQVQHSKPSCIYGNINKNGAELVQPSTVTEFALYRSPINHQSIFFSKDVLEKNQTYNLSYKVMADYELMLRLFSQGKLFQYINRTICSYEAGGFSETERGREILKKERAQIYQQYFSAAARKKYELRIQLTLPWLRKWLKKRMRSGLFEKLYQKATNLYYRISR